MFVYKTPIESYQRLLKNDISDGFFIIFQIKSTNEETQGFIIETQKEITINTTSNKARIISKVIDDQYSNNPKLNRFVFSLENSVSTNDIVEILNGLFNSKDQILISEDKRDLFNQILHTLNNEANQVNDRNIIICQYKDNLFSGIISYLKQQSNGTLNGNSDDLKISAGGDQNYSYPLSNILLYDNNDIRKYFANTNGSRVIPKSEAWIEFDFVNKKVDVTSYSIQTTFCMTNVYHPKTWNIMGSNDHENWSLIDQQIDRNELNGPSYSFHFVCDKKGQYYRYIKYVQLKNWKPQSANIYYENYIGMTSIEFFGSIQSEQNQ